MLTTILSAGIAICAVVVAGFIFRKLRKVQSEHHSLSEEHSRLKERFKPIVDVESERQRVKEEIERQKTESQDRLQSMQDQYQREEVALTTLQENVARLRAEFEALDEEASLQSFGVYTPHYDFASSEQYQSRLNEIRERQKQMIKGETAAVCSTTWTVGGSEAKGRQMIKQTLKLLLRAFNGESDAAIAKVKYNNVGVMESRIRKAWEAINQLGKAQSCTITEAYLKLRLEELFLAHEYQEKLQAEKEEQREIRERMREEERAQRELEKAKLEAEREEKRYEDAIAKARHEAEQAVGEQQQKLLSQLEALQQKLQEAQQNKVRAISQAQLTRSGHVYVISNVGSFGEHVYKIGMTRRLDPMERVRELGDASVPFDFDVHAIIYTDDAPALEAALHKSFDRRRVNRVNDRKEFFRVPIEEISNAVQEFHGEIEFTLLAEARDYRRTLAIVEEESIEIGVTGSDM